MAVRKNTGEARQIERPPRMKPMQRTAPPFRADHVGSLLRTAPLKDARAKLVGGAITPAQLKEIEDREIVRALDVLYAERRLARHEDGRYVLKSS